MSEPVRKDEIEEEVRLEVSKSNEYNIVTSSEMDAFERAIADGATGRNWTNNEYLNARVHQAPGLNYQWILEVGEDGNFGVLERLTSSQDADMNFALLYISHILVRPSIEGGAPTNPVLSLDDIISKIGWDPRNKADRQVMRGRIWKLLILGDRVRGSGARTGTYEDPMTGEKLPTEITSAPWRIMGREDIKQPSLFEDDNVPLRVELSASREFKHLLGSTVMAQYLPLGEVLGAIPGSRPSGAWARVIGLTLANFWRREPAAALDGSIKPFRAELLDRYPPKTGPVWDILRGKNPGFAITYWCGAMEILIGEGLLEPTADATESAAEMKARLPRKEWANIWMREKVFLSPGPRLRPIVQEIKDAKPVKRGRGRPRKQLPG